MAGLQAFAGSSPPWPVSNLAQPLQALGRTVLRLFPIRLNLASWRRRFERSRVPHGVRCPTRTRRARRARSRSSLRWGACLSRRGVDTARRDAPELSRRCLGPSPIVPAAGAGARHPSRQSVGRSMRPRPARRAHAPFPPCRRISPVERSEGTRPRKAISLRGWVVEPAQISSFSDERCCRGERNPRAWPETPPRPST
jgi:hypothetical protein